MYTNAFDTTLFHAINHATSHSYTIDFIMSTLASTVFFGGGWLTLFFWWYWFGPTEERARNRPLVACTLFSCYLSLVLARIVSFAAPWRARPLTDPPEGFIPSHVIDPESFVQWSSFPSDHAVLFFALATGLFLLSKRVGLLAFLYVTFLICLPRVYLGIHYPTDIIAGALIGVGSTLAVAYIGKIRLALDRLTATWNHRHPSSFYTTFYLLSFMLAVKFNELKAVGKTLFVFLKSAS